MDYEWQQIVSNVVDLKLRLDFGVTVFDKELSVETKIGIEAFQTALNKKQNKPETK